jgi:exonuclease SbcC
MLPISLTMTAFGPFSSSETVDFDKFGDAPLFLINGPTGSGKTTILDAICFALYGKTTGDEREGSQMRCDFAAADTLTKVSLTFELAGKHYRILRVPEQQRPKDKGEGTTTQSTEAQLWTLDSDGTKHLIVARKVKDATAEIENITGLNADQFRQVMVLPQGKFRQLLMADSKDREHIFGQLFQTQVYKKLEDILKSQSAEISREVNKSRQVQMGILESVELDSQQALVDELALIQPEFKESLKIKDLKDIELLSISKKLYEANALRNSFENLAKTESIKQQLINKQGIMDVQRSQLKKAEQAQKIKPEFDQVERSKQALNAAKAKWLMSTQQQSEAKQVFKVADENSTAMNLKRVELDTAKQEINTLESYHERAEKLSQSEINLVEAITVESSAQKRVLQNEILVRSIISDREKVEDQQQNIQRALSNLSNTQLAFRQSADQLENKNVLHGLQGQVHQAQENLDQAKQQSQQLARESDQAETEKKRLELSWHQGQAVILAQDLNAGQPCPVCGSNEHPSLAHSEHMLPTQVQLDQAKDHHQQLVNKLNDARENFASHQTLVKSIQKQFDQAAAKLGDVVDLSLTQLLQNYETLKQEVATLLVQQDQLSTLENVIGEVKSREELSRKQLDMAKKEVLGATAELAVARSHVISARQELPEAYREMGALQKAVNQAHTKVKTLEQQISLAQEAYKTTSAAWEASKAGEKVALEYRLLAEQTLEKANGAWLVSLQSSCFDTSQDYTNAGLSDVDFTALQLEISDYDEECQSISGAFDQQQKTLEGQQQPDMQVFETAHKLAEQAKETAEQEWRALDKRLSSLNNTEKKLQEVQASLDELEKVYAVIGTLSDVANGQTGDKVSLQRFVLSVLLDDVLLEASQRLSIMSKGRYQLLRKEHRSKGKKASGLELEVLDGYTGKVREVATLSGGESFMAALAMALGLSEVVQSYAGGIRLDTLFIDEGFGSLDSECLDLAVRTLIDLQASGRMVGVISHVSELKEQMPKRLDVIPGREGSTVQTIC